MAETFTFSPFPEEVIRSLPDDEEEQLRRFAGTAYSGLERQATGFLRKNYPRASQYNEEMLKLTDPLYQVINTIAWEDIRYASTLSFPVLQPVNTKKLALKAERVAARLAEGTVLERSVWRINPIALGMVGINWALLQGIESESEEERSAEVMWKESEQQCKDEVIVPLSEVMREVWEQQAQE